MKPFSERLVMVTNARIAACSPVTKVGRFFRSTELAVSSELEVFPIHAAVYSHKNQWVVSTSPLPILLTLNSYHHMMQ